MVPLNDRVHGALLGGAVGDALGAPVEFISLAEIQSEFGNSGIVDFAPAFGRIGAITDDTQMTLFTAEGVLRAYVRGQLRGIVSITSVVCHAYMRWLLTQGGVPKGKALSVDKSGLLWPIAELHSCRAPGNTCLSALMARTRFDSARADNDSKGAGGIMRIAPIAMIFANQPDATERVFQLAKEAAWITHGHPSGYLSAGAFAAILHTLLLDGAILDGVSRARSLLEHEHGSSECLAAMDAAMQLAENRPGSIAVLPQIGEGWVAEEALGVALYCALTAGDFAAGVRMAANHGGDSDTTGSLTGQLLGALYGVNAIPAHWLAQLELRELISVLAQDLIECHHWNLDDGASDLKSVLAKYPGG